jgi:hypothetical protein
MSVGFGPTPRPNLSRGIQYLLSGYANWYAKRHRRPGHLFQGRFRSELIEDQSYFWTVSRYIHLNPVRGKRPFAAHPRDWPWSSYPGYALRRRRVEWLAYDAVYSAWREEMGDGDPEAAYRRFVEAGLVAPPENPFNRAAQGWLLGSQNFVDRVRSLMSGPKHRDEVPAARRLAELDPKTVLAAVAAYYGMAPEQFQQRGSGALSRDVAAWLARRLTPATLRELAPTFGVNHPDSVHNLVRRVERALAGSGTVRKDIESIRRRLLETGNRT